MRSKFILFLVAISLFQLNTKSQTPGTYVPQKKIALLIGNGNYRSSVLANPENDISAMADVLQKLDFTVLPFTNLEQKDMKKAMDDFGLKLKDADVALFFYAGHGVQSRSLNYLVPVDASLNNEASIEYDCVQADRVMSLMDESEARIKIMILDACRNNPFEQSYTRGASGKGLALMKAATNTFIAYSTAPGSTASDGSGKNSIYTTALLESIIIPDLSIDQMFQNVGRIVSQKSNNEQIPWKSSSLTIDFYFNPERSTNYENDLVDYFLDPRDNKNYTTVKIGSQLWTLENLNYISFNNGDTIPEIKDFTSWRSATSSAYCSYNNITSNVSKYGRLYNFYAASDVRNLCPAGWHIPTNSDWSMLAAELGGSAEAGGEMKETGTEYWAAPNIGSTNNSGFSALPSGLREKALDFINEGVYAGFYSKEGHIITLSSESASLGTDSTVSFTSGISIRCIRGRNPLAEAGSATEVRGTSSTLNGKVNPNLATTIISFEYGISKDYGQTVIANQSPAVGSVPVIIDADLTDLEPGTTYHFRIKAENSAGLTYSNDRIFITPIPPHVSTREATSVSASNAILNGSVNANNSNTNITFEYGPTTDYGNIVIASQSPVSGNEATSVSSMITGLSEGTLYHYRVKAESIAGIITGNDQTFSTFRLPIVTAKNALAVASSCATLNGTVNTNNLPTTISFEYGVTTEYGESLDATENPVKEMSDSMVIASILGLTANMTYHFRVKATNLAGTTYSDDLTFTTPDIVKDYDGNSYETLIAGNQVWMAENLRTTKFNNGTEIPLVNSEKAWSRLKKPAYCWYKNEESFSLETGALYNWYTANTFNLCPTGWHVPFEVEWSTLIEYLGDQNIAGGKLKDAGTAHWQKPNEGATNEIGFTALPGGIRDFSGAFSYYGLKGQWWSAEDSTESNAMFWGVEFSSDNMFGFYQDKKEGYSVRCIKDIPVEIPKEDIYSPEEPDVIIDPRDGQLYKTAKFGNQIWMAENLKATTFNDSTEIPIVIDKIAWNRLESPAYCWYENHEAYSKYGALYNWHTIISGKLCPVGWHIPTEDDWKALINSSGGTAYAGGYLKEPGNEHWESPNSEYSKISLFNALPSGFREENGDFLEIGRSGYWWSTSNDINSISNYLIMNYTSTAVSSKKFRNKPIGLSVRCIKD